VNSESRARPSNFGAKIDRPTGPAVARPPRPRGHALRLERITHRFGAVTAVDDVDLDIRAGELVALLGPSGCGKTTVLRVIAGFLAPSTGRVLVDGEPVGHLPPHRRGVGIVFQNYALFPHMTVAENVAYGLEALGTPRAAARRRVAEMLALVRMEDFAGRFPRQLSGGQQQRVALARALAVEPRILLLDEPFGALDRNLRLDMQIEIKRLQRHSGVTSVLVTHDQEEALSIADRIAVLNRGRLEQFGTPTETYDRPASLFVNAFVGTTNLLPGTLEREEPGGAVVALDGGARLACGRAAGANPGARVVVSVRPERLRLERVAGEGRVPGTLRAVLPLGAVVVYEVEATDGTAIKVSELRDAAAAPARTEQPVWVEPVSREACLVFPAPA
jgi:putative spermidine/putrescine transport system ATP-binding protein